MKSTFLKFFCLLYPLISANSLFAEEKPKKILIMTLPKSGTNMLIKAIFLLTGEPILWVGLQTKEFDPKADLEDPHLITSAHVFPLFDQIRTDYIDQYKTVLLIRDPRDVMLSFANHLRRSLFWVPAPDFDQEHFLEISLDQQLEETFSFPAKYLNPAICFPCVSLWMKEPSVFICRFEDLVGPPGGGTEERQLKVLTDLAKHIGYPKTPEEIKAVASQIFGNTWTFYKGKIGQWEKAYNDENKEIFMDLYGNYISDWHYEVEPSQKANLISTRR